MEEFVVKCFGVSVIKKRFEVMNNSIFRKQVVRGLEITFEKRLLIHIYKDRWFWREKTGSLSNSRFNIVVNIDECFFNRICTQLSVGPMYSCNEEFLMRSEERRVGKECRYGWSLYQYKRKR